MFQLPTVATRWAGRVFLWGAAPPFPLEELEEALRRRGMEILRAGVVEIVFAFPEWTRPHRVIPHQIRTERGLRIRDPWAIPWLIRFGYEEPRAEVEGITLDGEAIYLLARDLDLDAVEACVAAPGWQRCIAGFWVERGPAVRIQPGPEEATWAAAWLKGILPPESRHLFEGILEEAARRGIGWVVLYREREAGLDLESRRRIEGMLLLARALRRYRVEIPELEALETVPLDALG
ncbi:hypothetical protein HRbin22_01187 [Candidatus Thermoflexus japonica]|uniref:Uncharacterized protein n=1 Tax=Candidatus Thermoflexus japonica TaxID=2035417 RepID=A0A2H5Y662_9CHLR|nr:hypothetical protein HRbin22_01187 [Candidatus Thermoflexus japonica]